jgi:hypothetical protein
MKQVVNRVWQMSQIGISFTTTHENSDYVPHAITGVNWQVEETAISINSLMIRLVKDKTWNHIQRPNKYSIFSLYFAVIFTLLVQQYLDISGCGQITVTRYKWSLKFLFLKLLFNGTYFRTWGSQLNSTKFQNMWHLTTSTSLLFMGWSFYIRAIWYQIVFH